MNAEKTELVEALPSRGGLNAPERIPKGLKGSTILFAGSEPDSAELILDFRTTKGEEKRVVLAFTELGMWVKSIGRLRHTKSISTPGEISRQHRKGSFGSPGVGMLYSF